MALAIGCWVKDTALEVNKKDLEYNKAMVSGMIISKADMVSTIPGMIGHNNNKTSLQAREAVKKRKEFIWLLKG